MTQSQQLRKLAARSATAFLLAALCVFPLYIDKFSNLGVVKFTGICTLSWAFALWLGALACVGARPDPDRLPWKADPALWALGAVTASGVVSTVLSLSPGASFWGLGGYYGGCMMVLFTAAGYLAVRAFAPQKILNGLTFCVGVTTALVTVLYVLNIFNIDLIGTYVDTAVVERAQFFSTLGQKNFCSGFMAFALPLVFYAFLVARGPRHTIFYGIPAFFGGLALAVAPWIGALASSVGGFIMWATELQPLLMGIVVSVLVGMALTLPISSAAICAALGLTGLAGGAAVAGCCAQMVGFAVMSYKENGVGGLVSQGLGTSMLQMPNILRNPRIWIPPTLAAAITGPIATCLFHLEMNGPAVSSGMGTCGLVGQIGVYTGWIESGKAVTAFDWIGLVLICFVLPAVLSTIFCEVLRKKGWIKEGDLKL